jgi:deoxyribodipyrimidine photo-lyase
MTIKKFKLSIHIFRRDLRLHDNTALLAALDQSDQVLPVFIFDERQLSNPFKGNNSLQFMIESLNELNIQLLERGSKIQYFRGISEEEIKRLLDEIPVEAVFVNRDYTPFSLMRDDKIAGVCAKKKVCFSSYSDALLTEPEQVLKNDGEPYTIFTPFMNKARELSVPQPASNDFTNFFSGKISIQNDKFDPGTILPDKKKDLLLKGGRREGKTLLANLKDLSDYDELRNIPSVMGTSLLSAHHKFGTVSIRETYHKVFGLFGKEHTLINELYWRDFFTHIAFHFPHALGKPFRPKYENIKWENNKEKFEHWCKGTTGFPIVDAGMRELVATGYMHNRVRMIVASFLVKDLHIDWLWGERFFANHLIDYDPAVNNGNWQWAASTGCDAQPYFRIFNPWSQQFKFDRQCIYIKKWVPELAGYNAKEIQEIEFSPLTVLNYPSPMVNHREESNISKEIYRKL